MQTVKSLKGVTLGTIEIVNGFCTVRWSTGEVMGFSGPAVIIFKHGKDTLLLAFDGEKIVKALIRPNWPALVTADPKMVVSEVKTRKPRTTAKK
jgi:hypothetical protein